VKNSTLEELKIKNFKICLSCKNFTKDDFKKEKGNCSLCGCVITLKGLTAKVCPLNLWEKWISK
jgi:PHP family Zn ribbon phosphoesterase